MSYCQVHWCLRKGLSYCQVHLCLRKRCHIVKYTGVSERDVVSSSIPVPNKGMSYCQVHWCLKKRCHIVKYICA